MPLRPPRLEFCLNAVDPDRLAAFYAAALGYGIGERREPYLGLVRPGPEWPDLFIQRVGEPRDGSVPNRWHLDLYTDDPHGLMDTVESAGATPLGEWRADGAFRVYADPEGNEFCVCAETGASGTHPNG